MRFADAGEVKRRADELREVLAAWCRWKDGA
jgi:hypothetical protein